MLLLFGSFNWLSWSILTDCIILYQNIFLFILGTKFVFWYFFLKLIRLFLFEVRWISHMLRGYCLILSLTLLIYFTFINLLWITDPTRLYLLKGSHNFLFYPRNFWSLCFYCFHRFCWKCLLKIIFNGTFDWFISCWRFVCKFLITLWLLPQCHLFIICDFWIINFFWGQ